MTQNVMKDSSIYSLSNRRNIFVMFSDGEDCENHSFQEKINNSYLNMLNSF